MVICIGDLHQALRLKDCLYYTKEFRYEIVNGQVITMIVRSKNYA